MSVVKHRFRFKPLLESNISSGFLQGCMFMFFIEASQPQRTVTPLELSLLLPVQRPNLSSRDSTALAPPDYSEKCRGFKIDKPGISSYASVACLLRSDLDLSGQVAPSRLHPSICTSIRSSTDLGNLFVAVLSPARLKAFQTLGYDVQHCVA